MLITSFNGYCAAEDVRLLAENSRNEPIPEISAHKSGLAVVLFGPPSSGKSTFVRQFIGGNTHNRMTQEEHQRIVAAHSAAFPRRAPEDPLKGNHVKRDSRRQDQLDAMDRGEQDREELPPVAPTGSHSLPNTFLTSFSGTQFKMCNSDDIYHIWSGMEQGWDRAASRIRTKMLEEAIKTRVNLILDTTGNYFERVQAMCDKLREHDYKIVVVQIVLEEARAARWQGQRNRQVGPEFFNKAYREIPTQLGQFLSLKPEAYYFVQKEADEGRYSFYKVRGNDTLLRRDDHGHYVEVEGGYMHDFFHGGRRAEQVPVRPQAQAQAV